MFVMEKPICQSLNQALKLINWVLKNCPWQHMDMESNKALPTASEKRKIGSAG